MTFEEVQSGLIDSINKEKAQFVYIDSDGTFGDWIAVVIESNTGVIYGTQCGGTACEQRYIEGFLIPCGGISFNVDNGYINSEMLTSPFHNSNGGCYYHSQGEILAESKIENIAFNVKQIPFWHYTNINDCTRNHLEIDLDRIDEICEAWIPVKTPYGRGVLIWNNCD